MTRDVAASVRQRLLNHARTEGRPFNEVLQYFALERFLYRLGRSSYRRQFVLKGALMFTAWQSPFSRPTRDIDLLGRLDNSVEHVVSVIQAICQETAPEDGMRFDTENALGERIIEAANYAGVRVRFTAYLGTARVPMQIDTGFGDPLVPGPSLVRLPTILDFPPPELQGYSRESAIAEKLQIMVYMGEVNSRIKDFYDVWLLANHFDFDGSILSQAIHETFRWRQTTLPLTPVAFTDAFAQNREKQTQWIAFIRRHRLEEKETPATLHEALQVIAPFLHPVIQALSKGRRFDRYWSPGGPWLPRDKTSEVRQTSKVRMN
ncbi:MAG: nucleotidyl transferase AbiEii/AbiGii toxin family protein [Anaerolineae bacterium]|nr:nucleotidyl transferase AbiEii/AbiGii toxin family protein [Anaerolineae bacterium]